MAAAIASAQLAGATGARALDLGSDPVRTFGLTPGMTLPEVNGALSRQGFVTSGEPTDRVTDAAGTTVADLYTFMTQDGQSIVIVEAGADDGDTLRAYRLMSVRYLAPEVRDEVERAYAAKFGDTPSCTSASVGALYHLTADGTPAPAADCEVGYAPYTPMDDSFAETMLTGEGWAFTASGSLGMEGDDQMVYFETVQNNAVAAEVYAAATGYELSEEAQEKQAEFERIIAGRSQGHDLIRDLLDSPDGYPVTMQGLRDYATRGEAVGLARDRRLAFLYTDADNNASLTETPYYFRRQFGLSHLPAYIDRLPKLMQQFRTTPPEDLDQLPTFERYVLPRSKFENGVRAEYRVSFAAAQDEGLGPDSLPTLEVQATYNFADVETPPNVAVFEDWADETFPGHCQLSSFNTSFHFAYQTAEGEFLAFADSGAPSCDAWQDQVRASGYSYRFHVREGDDGDVRSISLMLRDQGRTQAHLDSLIGQLGSEILDPAPIEPVEQPDPLAEPLPENFIAEGDGRRDFPKLFGLDLGLTAGEIADALKDQGFRFIRTGYDNTLTDEPVVNSVGANLVFRPFFVRMAEAEDFREPTFDVYAFRAERGTSGRTMTHGVTLYFMSEGGAEDYRDGTPVFLSADEKHNRGPRRQVEDIRTLLEPTLGAAHCTLEETPGILEHRFYTPRMREAGAPEQAEVECPMWEAEIDHRYQASYTIRRRGSDVTQLSVQLEDHEPLRAAYMD